MDCLVCQTSGIEEGSAICPECSSELKTQKIINRIEKKAYMQRTYIFVLGILFVISLAIYPIYFFFLSPDSEKSSVPVADSIIDQKNKEISRLTIANDSLQLKIDELYTDLEELLITEDTSQILMEELSEEDLNGEGDKSSDSDDSKTYFHTVKKGETLYSIAKKAYGNGSKYKRILEINNIKDPSEVKAGTVLKIEKQAI